LVLAERWKALDFTSPASEFCRSLQPFMPYLSANAAFRQAVAEIEGVDHHMLVSAEDRKQPMAYLAKHQTTDFTNRYDSDKAIMDVFGAKSPSDDVLYGVPMLKLRAQERFATGKVGNLSSWQAQGSWLAALLVEELEASPWADRLGVRAVLATSGDKESLQQLAAVQEAEHRDLQRKTAADAAAGARQKATFAQQMAQRFQRMRLRKRDGQNSAVMPRPI